MSVLEQKPRILSIPLREEPPGVFRVGKSPVLPPGVFRLGKSRVLLELVIRAHRRDVSRQDIVRMYDTLDLGDVFAVIAYSLAHPTEIGEYLRMCDEEADAVRRKIEASQPAGPSKEELLARARAKGLDL